MTERSKFFCEKATCTVNGWVFANILRFLQHHKERKIANKEITITTIAINHPVARWILNGVEEGWRRYRMVFDDLLGTPRTFRWKLLSVLFSGSWIIKGEKKRVSAQSKSDPWTLYLYAMKSPATENYLLRLGKFLDFMNLKGCIDYRSPSWSLNEISNSLLLIIALDPNKWR